MPYGAGVRGSQQASHPAAARLSGFSFVNKYTSPQSTKVTAKRRFTSTLQQDELEYIITQLIKYPSTDDGVDAMAMGTGGNFIQIEADNLPTTFL